MAEKKAKTIIYKKKLIYPNTHYWKDILAFYIQLVEPEYYHFQDLVSLLSYCIKYDGLTTKQIAWLNDSIIPSIKRIYMNRGK